MATKVFTKKFNLRIAILLTLLTIFGSLSPVFATATKAQLFVPVFDPFNMVPNTVTAVSTHGNTWKELLLDGLAWVIVNLAIEKMTASVVDWINSGFRKTPAFITDPSQYFQTLGDNIAGQYIFSNPNLNFLCGPIQAKIRLALTQNYLQERQWQCTLTEVGRNVEDFMGDFDNGGWDSFFELTQRPQNNPIGAYLQAERELNAEIANKQILKDKELNWGNGFMSFKRCSQWSEPGYIDQFSQVKLPDPPSDYPIDETREQRTCLKYDISTPGKVISDQLNKQLGLGQDKLAVADEFNEIVSALLSQVITQVVGGVRGLAGLSKEDPSNSNRIFTNTLQNNSTLVGYFCLDQTNNPNEPYYDTDSNVCKNPEKPNFDLMDTALPDFVQPDINGTINCANNPNAAGCSGGGRNGR